MQNETLIIEESHARERVDKVIAEMMGKSRSAIQLMLKNGDITVNGELAKPNYKVQVGDEIHYEVREPEELEVLAEDIPLDIYFEDKDMLVVNKPEGMVVHPSAGHASGTLVNALLFHCDDLSGINGKNSSSIVHRMIKIHLAY